MAEWLGGGLQNRKRGFDSRSQLQRHKPQGLKPGEGGPARSQARDYIMKSQMCQEKKENKFTVQRTVNMGYCVINQRKEIL